MTESDWETSSDPQAMLAYLSERPGRQTYAGISDRKLRLWVEACRAEEERITGRRLYGDTADCYDLDVPDQLRRAAENWGRCEGPVSLPVLAALLRDIVSNPWRIDRDQHWPFHKRQQYCTPTVLALASAAYDERQPEQRKDCFRCRNSLALRPGLACPQCRGAGWFISRPAGTLDPLRLAVLADALEELGCTEQAPGKWYRCHGCGKVFTYIHKYSDCGSPGCDGEDSSPVKKWVTHPIVEHLRSPGPHVRGCWAVDCILGKE